MYIYGQMGLMEYIDFWPFRPSDQFGQTSVEQKLRAPKNFRGFLDAGTNQNLNISTG
jgi:hypothetical protein